MDKVEHVDELVYHCEQEDGEHGKDVDDDEDADGG